MKERLSFETIAKELGPLVQAAMDDENEGGAGESYDVLYRSHSTFDAHPWKVLGQMLDVSADRIRIERIGPWMPPLVPIALMGMYLAILGKWIAAHRGEDVAAWEVHYEAIKAALGEPPKSDG